MTDLLHPVTLNASVDAPIGEALTHQAASVLIGEGLRAIIAERMEQVQTHGHTLQRDQEYQPSTLACAGIAYAQQASGQLRNNDLWHGPAPAWPWDPAAWKPGDARANLVKAAALIWAAIDRLDHAPADAGDVIEDDQLLPPRKWARAPAFAVTEPLLTLRACRKCGCTDHHACMDGDQACHWVAPDLCSACEPASQAAAA